MCWTKKAGPLNLASPQLGQLPEERNFRGASGVLVAPGLLALLLDSSSILLGPLHYKDPTSDRKYWTFEKNVKENFLKLCV
jgi:hypothetical protein